ncbi:MAG TPA: hypothetical protein VK171_02850 [Fimbriimonas sp.]|nr:hypothetical protein [Fimbriimonas sp.]
MRTPYWILGLVVLGGCAQLPNPNDLAAIDSADRVDSAFEIHQSVVAKLEYKVVQSEISDAERTKLLRDECADLLTTIDEKAVPPASAWKYADMLRVVEDWPKAEKFLAEAVKVADTPGRKITDTIRLAHAMAKNGKVEESVAAIQPALQASPEDGPLVLPAVLYEYVPAAKGQGVDKDLADILDSAIECQRNSKVDVKTDEGRAFMMASRYHIRKAEAEAATLRLNTK